LDDDDGHDARPSTRTDPSAACDDNEIEIEIEIEIKIKKARSCERAFEN